MQASLDFSDPDPTDPELRRLAIRGIEQSTGKRRLLRLYETDRASRSPEEDFFAAGSRLFVLKLVHDPLDLDRIPVTGPLVVVANHPFGVVDGCVLATRVARRRPDYRIVAHGLLGKAPAAAERILPIDFSTCAEGRAATSPSAGRRSAGCSRATSSWSFQPVRSRPPSTVSPAMPSTRA